MMTDLRWALAAAPLLLLAACDDAPKVDKRAGEAKQLTAGAYEVSAKLDTLAKADREAPATTAKVGDMTTLKGCVAADGTPEATLFIEPGDVCRATQSYSSGAILNIQYNCQRKGKSGSVNYSIDGQFTADGFTAKVTTGTSFISPDDYVANRSLTGKRVGNCPAAAAGAPAKA
ncbi:DUF3617 domain-containing protein [Sphingomonas sp. RB1R13]|uniref:DUF3617 domain-containing protein n=1 Tax=Sphingomonas sp. RB1R13 TaxID=3096159 RepID=UPI002FCB47F8